MLSEELINTNKQLSSAKEEIAHQLELINCRTAELERLNARLAEMDNLKNDFITNLMHDFRTPVMIIQNIIDLLLKYDQGLKEETRNKLGVVFESSLKLSKLLITF